MSKITRPVFIPINRKPFYKQINITFESSGISTYEEKQECIKALHSNFSKKYPQYNILEISTKSLQELGVQLSAFNLMKYESPLKKKIAVENIYQASKKFATYGPYVDLFYVSPKEAKKDERISSSGKVFGYIYQGNEFPTTPKYLFFDYIYISALYENPQIAHKINKYEAFTDIEFDPSIGTNCQAATVARLKGMLLANLDVSAILKEIEKSHKLPRFKNFKKKFLCEFPPQEHKSIKKHFNSD